MKTLNYFYDENKIRYTLVKSHAGTSANWLFMPGGPGGDSRYLFTLVKHLDMPGNFWLFDLPGNGSNPIDENMDFESWGDIFIEMIKRFENPILVGHSFGGMYPLLFPALEDLLQGLIILNSAPSLWLEESEKCAKTHQLPEISEKMQAFKRNPNSETFLAALSVCAPYYFPRESLEQGRKLLEDLVPYYSLKASAWWLQKAIDDHFTAAWIPESLPTLILGGTQDFICPFSLYENDQRFKRSNIEMLKIENAGHFSWIEKPLEVAKAFKDFSNRRIGMHACFGLTM